MILNSYNVSFDDIHQFTPCISIINGLPRRPSIILHFVNIYLSTVFMNPSNKLSLAVDIWKIVGKYQSAVNYHYLQILSWEVYSRGSCCHLSSRLSKWVRFILRYLVIFANLQFNSDIDKLEPVLNCRFAKITKYCNIN